MRRWAFVGSAGPIIVSVLLVFATAAGATGEQTTTPTVSGETSSTLAGVSCPTRVVSPT
jgi:hypothetical protein